MFEIKFLGTGAMRPTPKRFTSSLLVRFGGEVVMFDAGEGIQVRVAQSGFSLMKIDKIFITHFHGDHFYGLPGMIFTMKQAERTKPLAVYGPHGATEFIDKILSLGGSIPFEINVHELEPGETIDGDGYSIKTFEVEHGIPSIGYIFKEDDTVNIDRAKMEEYGLKPSPKFKLLKQGQSIEINGIKLIPDKWLVSVAGDSIAYTGDTKYTKSVIDAVKGVTVLVHDSTWLSSDAEPDRYHSSSRDAARVAEGARVKYLFLIHLSSRYIDAKPLLEEAREVFPQTYIPNDLDTLTVKKGELIMK